MISFNISVSKRDKFYKALSSGAGFQIMPKRLGYIDCSKYENIDNTNDNVLIHTGYDMNVFTNMIMQSTYKVNLYLKSYIELANKLKIKNILFHGPDTYETYNKFNNGLIALRNLKEKHKLNVIVEMPAFRKSLLDEIEDDYEFIKSYFNQIIKNELQICIDTAHLFANGLNVDQMIDLLEEFKGNYKFIHLNGNCKDVYEKDKHTYILNEDNNIEDADKLLKYISNNLKDIICIMEIKEKNYDEYLEMINGYKLKIVDESIHDLLC